MHSHAPVSKWGCFNLAFPHLFYTECQNSIDVNKMCYILFTKVFKHVLLDYIIHILNKQWLKHNATVQKQRNDKTPLRKRVLLSANHRLLLTIFMPVQYQ